MKYLEKGNRKYRNYFLIGAGGIITAFIVILAVLYLSFYPKATAEVTQPIVVDSNPIQAGSVIDYTVSICRHTSGIAFIERSLVRLTADETEELIVPLGKTTSKRPVGCSEFKPANVYIPLGLPSGEYYIQIDVCYQTTILQQQCGIIYTEPFFIISEEDVDNEDVQEKAEEQRERILERRESQEVEDSPITGNTPPEPTHSNPKTPPPEPEEDDDKSKKNKENSNNKPKSSHPPPKQDDKSVLDTLHLPDLPDSPDLQETELT